MPESIDIKREIKFNPETEMFCAFSSNKDALKKFAIELKLACDDEYLLTDLFLKADFNWYINGYNS